MTVFFGFAIADSMFEGSVRLDRKERTPESVASQLAALGSHCVSCVNPSHVATLNAAKSRYGINIEVPEKAPQVKLIGSDMLIVMSVRGLPRLGADRHEYTEAEIASATFTFSEWHVWAESDIEYCNISMFGSNL